MVPRPDPEAQRKYQREWLAKRRAEWFAANGPCVDCGSWDDLELDHFDSATKIHHVVWSWATERRLTELAKCVARCHPCHVIKSARSMDFTSRERRLLSPADVVEIRRRYASGGVTQAELGIEYGCSRACVNNVTLGRTWAWLLPTPS